MSLDPQVIKDSFELAKPIAKEVSEKFYEILFQDHPEARELFASVVMPDQQMRLVESLVYIVANVDKPDKLVPYLKNMGSRHTYYNISDEHYGWVGESLLKTFAFFFKHKWTPQLKQQWTLAYGVIAETMQAGAQEFKLKKAS